MIISHCLLVIFLFILFSLTYLFIYFYRFLIYLLAYLFIQLFNFKNSTFFCKETYYWSLRKVGLFLEGFGGEFEVGKIAFDWKI